MATWTIVNLERNVSDGGVTVAHWHVTESSGDVSASSCGTVSFNPDPSASDFVAYDNLTEATVLGWVWAEVDQSAIEAALTAEINSLANPTTADGMPW